MARTRRMWISDVVLLNEPGLGPTKRSVISIARQRARTEGRKAAPVVWAPPGEGAQLFIGLAALDDPEVTYIQNIADEFGARFRQTSIEDGLLDSPFTAAQRNSLNQMLSGTPINAVTNSETRRQAFTRIVRELDGGLADFAERLAKLRAHQDVDPTDPGT